MNQIYNCSTAGICARLVDGAVRQHLNHFMKNTIMLSRQSGDKVQKGSRSHREPHQSGLVNHC